MHTLVAQVATTIRREKLATTNEIIIIAISGGADSVALLMALLFLGYPLIALHANFNLRGAESQEDEEFVCRLCNKLNIPLQVKQMPTIAYAQEYGISVEMAARELRYEWFEAIRKEQYPLSPIAIAHNSDDQIETLLLNLSKGTGIRGLSGMPYKKTNGVIRPLLDCSRTDILQYLSDIGMNWREDSTNTDIRYQRNLIRHQLIPSFEQLNTAFRSTTLRTLEQLRDTEAFYLDSVRYWKKRTIKSDGIHLETLNSTPAPETLLYEILLDYNFSPNTIRAISTELPRPQSGNQYYSPTHRLVCSTQYLELFPLEEHLEFSHTISLGATCGIVELPKGKLYWRIVQHPEIFQFRPKKNEAIFDLERLQTDSLTIRGRREGDKIYPYGMVGAKKLRRIFIDSKYTHRERQEALLLCLRDEPIWLIGRISDRRFGLTSNTQQAIIFLYHTDND